MPLYDYRCSGCHKVIEVRHGFDETYEQPCDSCGAKLQRVIGPAPIIFKGSGFYVTDSRKKESAAAAPTGESKPAGPASESPAGPAAPAAATAPATTPKPPSNESAA